MSPYKKGVKKIPRREEEEKYREKPGNKKMMVGKRKLTIKDVCAAVADYAERRLGLLENDELTFPLVNKNNGVTLHGMALSNNKAGGNCNPTYYLENFVESANRSNDFDLETAYLNALSILRREKKDIDLSSILTRDYVLANVTLRVVSASNMESLLEKKVPFETVVLNGESAELISYPVVTIENLKLTGDDGGVETRTLSVALMERCHVDAEEVFKAAKKNIASDIKRCSMGQVLAQMFGGGSLEEEEDIADLEDPMTVISNSRRFNGASVLTVPREAFGELAEKKSCDLVILPSSIHEVIVIEHLEHDDPAFFKNVVMEVNESSLVEMEKLSDSVFVYRRTTGAIELLA